MLFTSHHAVGIFTVGAFAAWGLAFWWAIRQPEYRWYHVWMLSLVTVFWWLGESIAIRLGKYQYPDLCCRLRLPFGGTPDHPTALANLLIGLLPANQRPWEFPGCRAASWDIPLSVVAIEAALMFGILRIAMRLLKSERGSRGRVALATAGLSGLLLLNVTATLDPVVSTTRWCASGPDPGYHFLHVNLWQWYTTPSHPGYWYGVPLVNYAAWFLSAATFAFVARLDDERRSGIIKRYQVIAMYLLASVAIIAITLGLLIAVKLVVDRLFEFGFHHPFLNQKYWQFGVIGVLLLFAGLVLWLARQHRRPRLDAIFFVPKFMVFAFCLGLLIGEPYAGIFMVWLGSVVIASTVLLWTRLVAEAAHESYPARGQEPPQNVGAIG